MQLQHLNTCTDIDSNGEPGTGVCYASAFGHSKANGNIYAYAYTYTISYRHPYPHSNTGRAGIGQYSTGATC